MAGRRLPLALGLTVLGGGSYYLYTAGGSPKVASKEIQHDAASVSAKLRSEIPGKSKEAQKQGEEWAQKAGQKLDSTVDDVRAKANEADAKIGAKISEADAKFGQMKTDGIAKFEQVRKETGKEMHDTIDKFDKTVERKTSEAKSGLSSWFGFGK